MEDHKPSDNSKQRTVNNTSTNQRQQQQQSNSATDRNKRFANKRQSTYNKRPMQPGNFRKPYETNIGYSSVDKNQKQRNYRSEPNNSGDSSWRGKPRGGVANPAGSTPVRKNSFDARGRQGHDKNSPKRAGQNYKRNPRFGGNYSSQVNSYDFELISVKRIVKAIKGGRRFRFSVTVVIGDYKNKIGYGVGKAGEIPIAILKARANAAKKLIHVNINPRTQSILFDVSAKYNATKVYLKKARIGTGVVAGGSTKQLLSFSGIKNIYAKSHGSRRKLNMIKATIKALEKNQLKGWIKQDFADDVH